jgi:hypothetical protein
MRKALRWDCERLEILGKNDSILQFRDLRSAADFLRTFSHDPQQMAILRCMVAEHCPDPHRLTTEQILRQLGSLLVCGRIKILRSVRAEGEQGSVQEEPRSRTESASSPPGNAAWIEINLRDSSGQPVARERYRIKLPDASVQEGTLDDFGHAEYYSINRGNCQVSFPDLEDEDWEWMRR